MKTRVSIAFWANNRDKGAELCSTSPVAIYCRITVQGKRLEYSTGLATTYGNWVAAADMSHVKGRTPADKHINTQLTKLRDELTDIWADLERQGKPVTGSRILAIYKNGGSPLSLLELYKAFLLEREGLIGVEIAPASQKQAQMRFNRLSEFLAEQKVSDLRPEEFTHNMGDKLLQWLLKSRNYKRNTANKVLSTMSQVLTWGIRREYLDKNPLALYKRKSAAPAEIKFLSAGELRLLTQQPMPAAYLDRARDCFVLQCWTGLAYADLAALDVRRDARIHLDKATNTVRRVLYITRAKSTMQKGYECVIPLLPEAERILAKYEDEMPVPTNQVYNRFLKELGQICQIDGAKMTSHVGRKTSGTLLLNMGIPLPVVSKFLGHANTIITQKLYAKLLDTTVIDSFAQAFGGAPAPAFEPTQAIELLPVVAPFNEAQVLRGERLERSGKPPGSPLRPARRVGSAPAAPEPEPSRWLRPAPVTSHGATQ